MGYVGLPSFFVVLITHICAVITELAHYNLQLNFLLF